MFGFIKMWKLLRVLDLTCISERARLRREDKEMGRKNTHRTRIHYLEEFLEMQVDRAWFGLYSYFSEKKKDILVEKYRNLLFIAQNFDYIEMHEREEGVDSRITIHILPEGSFFASPTNGLSAFLKKYWYVGTLCFSIIGLLIAWSPLVQEKIQEWNSNNYESEEISKPTSQGN